MTIPTRPHDAPVLSWVGEGGAVYVEIDAIPTFEDAHGGKLTDFAIEDGTSIAEHFVREPQFIRFEINQTPTPIDEAVNEKFESSMEWETIELEIPENRFKPTGLLLAMTALGSGVEAIGGALGLVEPPSFSVKVLKLKNSEDRINALYDDLEKAFGKAGRWTLHWLGRDWEDFVIERFGYTRQGGRQLGVFNIEMKKVNVVTTATAQAIQLPAELTMKLPVNLGNRPGQSFKATEERVRKKAMVEANPPPKLLPLIQK